MRRSAVPSLRGQVDGLASEDDLQLDAIPAGGLEEAGVSMILRLRLTG